MAFCFTVGTHGYENVTAQCHNCGNWSAQVITEWPFFTFCFIPVVPLAFKKYKLVACPICHYKQDMVARPDVESQGQGHGGGGPPPQGMPPHGGPPPPPQGQMHYQGPPPPQQQPQYK